MALQCVWRETVTAEGACSTLSLIIMNLFLADQILMNFNYVNDVFWLKRHETKIVLLLHV